MNKRAFTLAEVLITLAVIGVVAAISVPALQNSVNEQQYKTAYKKAFQQASTAWKSLAADNFLESRPDWNSYSSNVHNFTNFINKFDTIKTCVHPNNDQCWAPNQSVNEYWGQPFVANSRCFIDKSGMSWCEVYSWGYFLVDTNGFKPPNKAGKDRFAFVNCVDNEIPTAAGCLNGGIPNVLKSYPDYTSVDIYICPSPPCYYRKWLLE